MVAGRVDPASRVRLSRLLLVDLVTRRSEFDRLKDAAKAASLNKFKARLDYLRELDELGPTEAWLEGLPPGKVAHFAESERLRVFGEVLSVVREAVTLAGTENEDPQPGGGTAETSAPDGTAAAQQAGRLVSRPWTRREGLRR
jgi:hypothetical protein